MSRVILPSGEMMITADVELSPWNRALLLEGHRMIEGNVRTAADENGGKPYVIVATKAKGGSINRQKLDVSFLRDASSTYQISPDPRDFVFVSLPIVTAGIPNRNMDCFTKKELLRFNPRLGRRTYQTFIAKPCHLNHVNQDPSKAKGIHFDATFRTYNVQPGSIGYDAQTSMVKLDKVRILTGWCRQKDPAVAQSILRRERTGYSMGALVGYATCGLPSCQRPTTPKPCPHSKGTLHHGHLAYDNVWDVNFIETSVLDEEPADFDAWSKDDIWATGMEASNLT